MGEKNAIKKPLLPAAPGVIRTNSTNWFHIKEPGCFCSPLKLSDAAPRLSITLGLLHGAPSSGAVQVALC